MSIFINGDTKFIVQGITGKTGLFHTSKMIESGTQIVGGVSPETGGEWVLNGKIPVFDTVASAVDATGAAGTILFVPPINAYDAIMEAIYSQLALIICVTEGIPIKEMLCLKYILGNTSIKLLGPGTPGILSPNHLCIGVIPEELNVRGNVGVVSRSGTLAYEIIFQLIKSGLGISTYVGLGSGEILGTDFVDILEQFEQDPLTEKILIIGEGGGSQEEKAANFIAQHITKPVIGFVPGILLSKIIKFSGDVDIKNRAGSIENKIESLQHAGVRMARMLQEIPALIKNI